MLKFFFCILRFSPTKFEKQTCSPHILSTSILTEFCSNLISSSRTYHQVVPMLISKFFLSYDISLKKATNCFPGFCLTRIRFCVNFIRLFDQVFANTSSSSVFKCWFLYSFLLLFASVVNIVQLGNQGSRYFIFELMHQLHWSTTKHRIINDNRYDWLMFYVNI